MHHDFIPDCQKASLAALLMIEMPTATHLKPESGEVDKTTLQNDITHCGVDRAIHHARAIDDRERPAVGIDVAGACRRRWGTDNIPGESFHQEAPEATFVELHANEPALERAHAADAASRLRLPLRPRQGPFGAEAGEREVVQQERGQGRRRRRLAVEARRGASRAADGEQLGALLDEGKAADHDAEDVLREARARPVLRLLRLVGPSCLGSRGAFRRTPCLRRCRCRRRRQRL